MTKYFTNEINLNFIRVGSSGEMLINNYLIKGKSSNPSHGAGSLL
jgi:hypothetical protein